MPPAIPILEARHFSKRFGGTLALDDVSLTIDSGTVHGLVGHNGSGKSTLIKILGGYHAPEPDAELIIDGKPVRLPLAPGLFRGLGMAFVHQDPGLIASLSVVENLRIGAIAQQRVRPIRWGEEAPVPGVADRVRYGCRSACRCGNLTALAAAHAGDRPRGG